jgi:AcrR family transcriptional regulator
LHEAVPVIAPSTKEQILRAAERLFAERGVEGVSLRQISSAAGNGNNYAVQYHFGSKDQLVQAIFEFRLPTLMQRRRQLVAERRPDDLRGWVECHLLPILEQGEDEGSHYLSFVAMLRQYGHEQVFARLPGDLQKPTLVFYDVVRGLLPHIPEPLRSHRISQAMTFSVHAASDRERARAQGLSVLPVAVHFADLVDGLVGFLDAPVSPAARAAADRADLTTIPRSLVL